MKVYTDKQLIINYLKGDEKALEILIKRYLKSIYSFAFRFVGNGQEAEDITQEVFIKMWRNLKKFKKNGRFKNWLFTIAKNACFDFLREKKKISILSLEDYFYLVDSKNLPKEIFEKESLKEKIQKLLERLSFKTKEVLNLYYAGGLTFREIAEISGESINTVKSRHKRALAKLREILKVEEN
jgi:RNA polymerase sigma-70 factor (ECF subfamily)